jgi:8-oxo-dGTP pyrophosphatase MutT (NUDIX family)
VSRQAARPGGEVTLDPARKAEGRSTKGTAPAPQFGALPWRQTAAGAIEVMLISSRDTGRWIIPKGWPIEGRTGAETAAVEAYEEAGIEGVADRRPIGSFDYLKCDKRRPDRWCRVTVYPLEVKTELADWPERDARQLVWLAPEEAAVRADDAGLAVLIRALAARGH